MIQAKLHEWVIRYLHFIIQVIRIDPKIGTYFMIEAKLTDCPLLYGASYSQWFNN